MGSADAKTNNEVTDSFGSFTQKYKEFQAEFRRSGWAD